MLKRATNLKIRDIVGLHRSIEELENALSLPPLRTPPDKLIPRKELKRLTAFQPIPVQATGNRQYVCLGNLALFRMLKHSLEEDANIHCLIFDEVDSKEVQRRTLTELFFSPAISGPAAVDLPRLYLGFVAAFEAGHFPDFGDTKPARVFSKLFGVDPRSLPAAASNASKVTAGSPNPETNPASPLSTTPKEGNGKEV
jgi:hypothetical protein